MQLNGCISAMHPVSNYPGFLVIFFYLEFDSLQRSNESEGRSAERKK